MTEGAIRNTKLGCGIIVAVIWASTYAYFHFARNHALEEAVRANRERGGRSQVELPPGETARTRQLEQSRSRDPEAALKIADEIIAQPASTDERRVALFHRPGLLKAAAIRALENGRQPEADALRDRLEKTYPASQEIALLRHDWGQALASRAAKAMEGTDRAAEKAAFEALWSAGPDETANYVFEAWAGKLAERWRRARATDAPEAPDLLIAAASVLPTSTMLDRLAGELATADRSSAQALAALGEQQSRAGRSAVALVFCQAALQKLEQTGTWAGERPLDLRQRAAFAADLRRKLSAGLMDLGDRLRRHERIPYVSLDPHEAYAAAARSGRGLVAEMDAVIKLLDYVTTDEFARLAEPVLSPTWEQLADPKALGYDVTMRMTSAADNIRRKAGLVLEREGVRLWECCLETPGFDPWPNVPAAVREKIDGVPAVARPEAERRKRLADYYRKDYWSIPLGELEPLRALMNQLYARWGIVTLASNAEGAFSLLRRVLRDSGDPALRAQVVQTLRTRLVRSREANGFTEFYTLSGFYAGEIGLPAPGDPFREEFRQGLDAAVKNFRVTDRMKLIFSLSLLAQCFPHEEAGQAARAEAFKVAFEVGSRTPAERRGEGGVAQSPLPGHSVDLINNDTGYHLLAFYRGPEDVMVRYWPWRHGTVVLPDGPYEEVVLCADPTINPVHSGFQLKANVRVVHYEVAMQGKKPDAWEEATKAHAQGDFQLLYAPAARAAALKVEPRTGWPLSVN